LLPPVQPDPVVPEQGLRELLLPGLSMAEQLFESSL